MLRLSVASTGLTSQAKPKKLFFTAEVAREVPPRVILPGDMATRSEYSLSFTYRCTLINFCIASLIMRDLGLTGCLGKEMAKVHPRSSIISVVNIRLLLDFTITYTAHQLVIHPNLYPSLCLVFICFVPLPLQCSPELSLNFYRNVRCHAQRALYSCQQPRLSYSPPGALQGIPPARCKVVCADEH